MEGGFRGMGRGAHRAVRTAVAALFPHHCVRCGAEGAVLCGDCEIMMNASIRGVFRCPECGRQSPAGRTCGQGGCAEGPLRSIVAMASYADIGLQRLLRMYKYEGVIEAGDVLERALVGFLGRSGHLLPFPCPVGWTPVPMHRIRRASRGLDQAQRFAEAAAHASASPFRCDILSCRLSFTTQARLHDHAVRVRNAEGRFRAATAVEGDWVLVDDVYTTGATMRACATALRTAGARSVSGIVLLRG